MTMTSLPVDRKVTIFGGQSVDVPEPLQILEGLEEPGKESGTAGFRIISVKHGDQRIQWFKHDLKSINEARNLFNDLVRKGMIPHKVGSNGAASSEIMTQFDPAAEEVIFMDPKMIIGG